MKVFIRCFKPWGSDFAEIHCRGECHGPVELVFMCRLSVRCCVGGCTNSRWNRRMQKCYSNDKTTAHNCCAQVYVLHITNTANGPKEYEAGRCDHQVLLCPVSFRCVRLIEANRAALWLWCNSVPSHGFCPAIDSSCLDC